MLLLLLSLDTLVIFCCSASLVGGFNPSEKYRSKWEFSPNRGEDKKKYHHLVCCSAFCSGFGDGILIVFHMG